MPFSRNFPVHPNSKQLIQRTLTIGADRNHVELPLAALEEEKYSSRYREVTLTTADVACIFHNLEKGSQAALKELQHRLNRLGISLNPSSCVVLLRLYGKFKSLSARFRVPDPMVQDGAETDIYLASLLVQIHILCGALEGARILVSNMHRLHVIVWNSLVGAYAQQGKGEEAVQVFEQMHQKEVVPDKVTFINALSACACLETIIKGRALHDRIISSGLELDVVVGTALLNMYGKCGSPTDAQIIFHLMQDRNVISWTTMIAVHAMHGQAMKALQLFSQMEQEGMIPNRVTFICLLNACTDPRVLEKGKQIHIHVISERMKSDIILMTALVSMYGKCGIVDDAQRVFDELPDRDVVSWNALIAVYARNGYSREAFQLFHAMQHEAMIPGPSTLVNILSACCNRAELANGKIIHSYIICSRCEADVFMATALVNMYGKCDSLEHARCLFDMMQEQNLVSWNTMITIFAQHRHAKEVLELLNRMQSEGVIPNNVTFISILEAYADHTALAEGKRMHSCIIHSGCESDVVLATALLNMYYKCGSLEDAWRVFNKMPDRNVVSWNIMVATCDEHEHETDALEIFEQMNREGVNPDNVTYINILSICANQLAFTEGKHIHTCIVCNGLESDIVVATAVMNVYGRCGSLEDAYRTFNKICKRNIVAWNVMIGIYAQHGQGWKVLQLVDQMASEGVIPNKVTFIVIFSACSHTGMLDEQFQFILHMQAHDITPIAEHYDCIIDLLGRQGRLDEAEQLISKMPFKPNALSWMTLLGACRNVLDVERGEHATKHIFELDPRDASSFLALANINFATGRRDEGEKIIRMMKDKCLKQQWCSVIEVSVDA